MSGVFVFPYVQTPKPVEMPIFMNNASRTVVYILSMPIHLFSMSIFYSSPTSFPSHLFPYMNLHIFAHHGNHEIEQTDSLNESETQNGV